MQCTALDKCQSLHLHAALAGVWHQGLRKLGRDFRLVAPAVTLQSGHVVANVRCQASGDSTLASEVPNLRVSA